MKYSSRGHAKTRALTGASISALLIGAGLAAMPVAQAADSQVAVTNSQIAPEESTYAGWHQGAEGATGRFGVSSQGLKQIGRSQVIYGYADNANSGLLPSGVNADVADLIGAKYDVTDGEAFFQVPIFVDTDGSHATPGVFATLRPAEGATADTTIAGDDLWMVSKPIPGVEANTPTPLTDLVAAVDDRNYKTIGFGVYTDPDKTATVSTISFDGKTYTFTGTPAASSTVKNSAVKGVENDETYTSWHQGYDNASGRQHVTANGLELSGKSQVIKGFTDNDGTYTQVNASLASVLDDASYTVESGHAYFQIAVRSANAAGGFTTLRTDAPGAGKHSLADATWQSSKAIGSIEPSTDADMADIVRALGTYKVIAEGVLTIPGESAVVSNITFGANSYDFADDGGAITSETVESIAPDESTYAGWHQGASGGQATISGSELRLGSAKSQVIKGYADNTPDLGAQNADLNAVLPNAAYTVVSGTVHFQVPLFFGNAEDPSFTTLRPTDPASTGVNTISISDEWTSSKTITGVVDAGESAPLGDILSGLGDYKVLGFGVFSDTDANGVVMDITWDGVKYGFDVPAPEPVNVVKTTNGVNVNSAGETVVNISCTEACSGWAQLRSDEAGTKKSGNVFYYKLSKAGWMPMKFTGVPNADASWKVRLAIETPVPGSGPSPQFNNVELHKGSTASVNVVKTTTAVRVSTGGNATVNISCTQACSGWVQLWSDGKGGDKSANVVYYKLSKAGYMPMKFTGLDHTSAKWFARVAIQKPTAATGTSPVFHNLYLAAS